MYACGEVFFGVLLYQSMIITFVPGKIKIKKETATISTHGEENNTFWSNLCILTKKCWEPKNSFHLKKEKKNGRRIVLVVFALSLSCL